MNSLAGKCVALVGFAKSTRELCKHSQADEFWSVNWAYQYDFLPRIDRIYELHEAWAFEQAGERHQKRVDHWQWLKQNRTIPIWMTERRPEVPMCRVYPLAQVCARLGGVRVLSSSVDLMMAHAIYEGASRIEWYGIEMSNDTEYRYQRPGAYYWIGQCDARGIELVLPESSRILPKKIYGFEGAQMIARQDIERYRNRFLSEMQDQQWRTDKLMGELEVLHEADMDSDDKEVEYMKSRDQLMLKSGAAQALSYLLEHIDFGEDGSVMGAPMNDPLEGIDLKALEKEMNG
jgi:hypothetical protein